jgi:very-short-patch-repair endonuclease
VDLAKAEWIAEALGVLGPVCAAAQAVEVRRKLRSGHWQRVGRCIVTHNGPLSADQMLWAAVLSPRGARAVARESALAMAGLKGLRRTELCIVVAWGHTPPPIVGVKYVKSRRLEPVDIADGYPARCTPARAAVDAASRASKDGARTLIAMVVQQNKATPADLRHVLDRLTPVRREVLLRVTVDDVEGGAHSLPELRFTTLVRGSDLPPPSRQVVRRRPDGRYYLDVAWDDYAVVAEIDGSHHRNAGQWEADALRHDELVIGGDRVLRLPSSWIRDRPALVLDLLRRALLAAGWRP